MLTFHSYGFFIGLGIVAGLLVVEKVKEKFPDTRYPMPVNYLLFLASDFWIDWGPTISCD